ncbi:hypothetical protein BJX76DRAFT_100408 [Aspergillus varians]
MAFVPSASAFSLPLFPWQQDSSLRAARYESRKRKNQYDTAEDESSNNNGDDGETTDAVSDFGLTDPPVILSPEEVSQYRVAGLPLNEELPGGHFPHAPAKEDSREVNNRGSVLKQLSALSTPIYAPESAAHKGNLRLRHLAVLTSVLHRCLLDGDYIRAGRAWGLLIREQFKGHPIDVRAEDRWGIGAEILLRKDHQMSREVLEGEITNSDCKHGRDSSPKLLFTRKGFEDAKKYYETLIIQHPYQKTAPGSINSLHFYPAMFGLWVYVTQGESAASRTALEERDPDSIREPWDDEDETDDREDWWRKHHRLEASIRANELAEAYRIAGAMDGILTSPPYSDSPELLELRGMVSQWIADLLVSSLPPEISDDDEFENDHDMGAVDGDSDIFMSATQPDRVEARQQRREAMDRRDGELARSQEFMEKAQQRKRGVASRMEELHIVGETSMHSSDSG